MIEIISERTIRLLLDNKLPMTSKHIAKEIGMSESSVKHNMKEVRGIIETTGAILKSVPGKGFWIEANREQVNKIAILLNENKDKAYSFIYRRNYILNILFINNSDYTIQIFADDLGVGRNVIIKDLEAIERWLGFFDIKMIRVRNKGILIEGREFDIRQAIIYNNSSMMDHIEMDLDRPDDLNFRVSKTFYNYFQKIYSDYDIYEMQNILLKAEKEMGTQFEDVAFIQIIEYLTVTFDRIRKGNILLEHNILNNCRISKKEYDSARNIITGYFKNVQGFFLLEVRCLAAQFVLYSTYAIATNSFIKEEYYEDQARLFIESIQSMIINQKVKIDEKLISDIGAVFKKKKMQQSYQITNSNYLKRDIRKQLSSLYAIVMGNIQTYETKLKVKFTENDIAYFTMLIDNAIEEINDDLSTLMITSFDNNIATYLKKKMERNVIGIRIDKVITLDEIENEDLHKYDMVVTTVLLDIENVVKVSRRVDEADLELLKKEVILRKKNKQKLRTRKDTLFREDLIVCHFKAKRKEDVLEFGAALLVSKNYVTSKFINVLFDRENFISTAIGNGVAIPHGYKTEVLKNGIAIIILDRAIQWTETEKVEIVFVIAINSDNRNEIYQFFTHLYRLFEDNEALEKIKTANEANVIFHIIEEVGNVIGDSE